MTWTAYRVTLRLLAPMHIGWRKLGNLQQTRPYVTGRVLWGALTARLTRVLGSHDYKKMGEKVDEQLAFSYFYPFTSAESDEIDLAKPVAIDPWPWGNDWDKFAWTFLGSYASTALENARNAEAGSLHETEFIAPYARNLTPHEDPIPVYLVGYIFQKEDYSIGYDWKEKDVLDRLQIGGERSYGWGRVRCKGEPAKDKNCFGYELVPTGDHPQIIVPKGKELLAHTEAEGLEGVKTGTIEPLVGRETGSDTGFGKNLSRARICWVPGSTITKEKTFQIQARGIWK